VALCLVIDTLSPAAICVLPNPFNQHAHVSPNDEARPIPGECGANLFFLEYVGYQKAAIQEKERAMLSMIPMKPTTAKCSRLQMDAQYIKSGTVLFPRRVRTALGADAQPRRRGSTATLRTRPCGYCRAC
jgi:hypothetical protein